MLQLINQYLYLITSGMKNKSRGNHLFNDRKYIEESGERVCKQLPVTLIQSTLIQLTALYMYFILLLIKREIIYNFSSCEHFSPVKTLSNHCNSFQNQTLTQLYIKNSGEFNFLCIPYIYVAHDTYIYLIFAYPISTRTAILLITILPEKGTIMTKKIINLNERPSTSIPESKLNFDYQTNQFNPEIGSEFWQVWHDGRVSKERFEPQFSYSKIAYKQCNVWRTYEDAIDYKDAIYNIARVMQYEKYGIERQIELFPDDPVRKNNIYKFKSE